MSFPAPDVLNYMVGKGKIYFARTDVDGDSMGEMDLGNDPTFAATPTAENLDHYSSMSGHKLKDRSVNIGVDLTIKFTLDEVNIDNLNLALMGADTLATESQGDGNVDNEEIVAKLGNYVKLAYRVLTDGTIVVTDSTGATTYIEDTDYTVDLAIGRIRALTTGAISADEALLVDYSYTAISYQKIETMTRVTVEGLLRFRGDVDFGSNYEIICWKVKLTATGDIPFISEEWSTIEFEAEVLSDKANHPNSPYADVIDISGGSEVES